jgi:multidrug efflux pump subunit AcrB
MSKQKKAIADLAVNILANVAVVGIGLALFEQKWWCMIIAVLATGVSVAVTWRSNHD